MTFNSGENGHSGINVDKPVEQEFCMWKNTSEKLKIKVFSSKRSVSSTLINQKAASKILNKSASFTANYLTFITVLRFSKWNCYQNEAVNCPQII